MNYYKLTSNQDNGTIVRTQGRNHEQFIPKRGWVRSGILMKYFAPYNDNELYNLYEEITETEALQLIKN